MRNILPLAFLKYLGNRHTTFSTLRQYIFVKVLISSIEFLVFIFFLFARFPSQNLLVLCLNHLIRADCIILTIVFRYFLLLPLFSCSSYKHFFFVKRPIPWLNFWFSYWPFFAFVYLYCIQFKVVKFLNIFTITSLLGFLSSCLSVLIYIVFGLFLVPFFIVLKVVFFYFC